MPQPFRLAQVSDLHLTADEKATRSEPKLWGKLRGMNANFRTLLNAIRSDGPECLLVSGDVTDCGEQRAWEIFWEELQKAGLEKKALVVPGNHDVAVLGMRTRPKTEDLARARAGLRGGGQPTSFPWARKISEEIVVFGLDSTNGGNSTGMTNAVGWLGSDQLIHLGKLLVEHSAFPTKLILLHHSPNIPGKDTARRRGEKPASFWERASMQLEQIDRVALRILAATLNVKAILHGHTHDDPDRRVNDVRMIGCPASTEPKGGRLFFRSYEISPGSGRLRVALKAVDIPQAVASGA